MQFKWLVKLRALLLGKTIPDRKPRADMYLPIWVLFLGLVLLVGGVAAIIYDIVSPSVPLSIGALVVISLGVAAVLCWKNQTIHIVSDDSFTYTTFLGNKKVCSFSDIVGLTPNSDSMTLLVGDEKIHIEACAILSDKLIERIDERLSKG